MRTAPIALAVLFAIPVGFLAWSVSAATDDQNLTGLAYLADGTPLSATPWADNTSFAVYVNHGGTWATAWRYPASPSWYMTSGGAYSIVLPAVQKDVSWSNGDPYRVAFDVSAISSTPVRIENATSHGTGDPGEFPPLGYTDNAIVWNATDNWQRWDVVLLALPDLAVLPGDVTATPGTGQVGQVVSFSATVRNLGNASADAPVALFDDADGDRSPDPGEVFDTPPVSLLPGQTATFVRSWVAAGVGTHALCAYADPANIVRESNEGNNVDCAPVLVQAPPETRPDYVPASPQPPTPVRAGLSAPVTFSLEVRNDGNATATAVATLAFFNESTPASPFAASLVPPLAPSATSARFTAPWTSPAAPGTVRVVADVDSAGDLIEWNETNNRFTWTVDVLAGPVTDLVVGAPNVTATETYVTSATLLSFSVQDQSGAGIRNTTYRVDGGPPVNFTATGPFTLAGDGAHVVEWSSEDFAGNVEPVANATLYVDDTPPAIVASLAGPVHFGAATFVAANTTVDASAIDPGTWPSGLASLACRIGGGPWVPYLAPFTLPPPDGPKLVECRAADRLGNAATVPFEVVLDTTPPIAIADPGPGTYPPDTRFSLNATDAGSGVASVWFRIDGGGWVPYVAPFALPLGGHEVDTRAVDNVTNAAEGSFVATVVGPSVPPAANYKPLVAAVFAAILAAAGAWASRRRPWKGGPGWKATLTAFLVAFLPFVLAEAATGIVSLATGLLSIPPVLDAGTIVDVSILAIGLAAAVMWTRRNLPPAEERAAQR